MWQKRANIGPPPPATVQDQQRCTIGVHIVAIIILMQLALGQLCVPLHKCIVHIL